MSGRNPGTWPFLFMTRHDELMAWSGSCRVVATHESQRKGVSRCIERDTARRRGTSGRSVVASSGRSPDGRARRKRRTGRKAAEGEPPRRNGGRKTLDIGACLPASWSQGDRMSARSISLQPILYYLLSESTSASFRGPGSDPWGIMNHSSVKGPSCRIEGFLIEAMDKR